MADKANANILQHVQKQEDLTNWVLIKQKVLGIVQLLQDKEALSEDVKNLLKDLNDAHGISPKVAKKTASILHKNKMKEYDDEDSAVRDLVNKINN